MALTRAATDVAAENEVNQPSEGSLREADKTSNPVDNDAQLNDPPLRTNRPDVPLVTTLAVGAGASEEREFSVRKNYDGVDELVDKDGVNRDGRVVAAPAKGSSAKDDGK